MDYYSRVNPDLLQAVPMDAGTLLEIGCGAGLFAQVVKGRNPALRTIGVELFEAAANQARAVMDSIIVGDIEDRSVLNQLDRAIAEHPEPPDVLVFGDVLEHLRDPWRLMRELRPRMKAGALCAACIPNVAHWSLVHQQLRGRWDYADAGLLDRTHLRFFTLQTARSLFEQAGWTILDAKPRILQPDKTEAAVTALLPVAQSLGVSAEQARRDLSAFQWVIRATHGPTPRRTPVVALGLRKFAGVTEARVDHPMTALASRPDVWAQWSSQSLSIPRSGEPGVLILHRQFMDKPEFNAAIERQIERGWTVVADMDDDPRHWAAYVDSGFHAFRGVHAVTVSTPHLADLIRQWNPHVAVFPNQILQLPSLIPSCPKADRPRIFFGALNRAADWAPVHAGILQAAHELGRSVQWIVVHDQAFHDALPAEVDREFHGTLAPADYIARLASCDINLLPLADTPFNRLKSDLKFIESCAAGAVPVASPVVYDDEPAHGAIGRFAQTADEWAQAIVALCRDPQELAQRRALGLRYVSQQRLHSLHAAARLAHYRTLIAQRPELERDRQQRLSHRSSVHG